MSGRFDNNYFTNRSRLIRAHKFLELAKDELMYVIPADTAEYEWRSALLDISRSLNAIRLPDVLQKKNN